jgi:hypothetical protein
MDSVLKGNDSVAPGIGNSPGHAESSRIACMLPAWRQQGKRIPGFADRFAEV